MKYAAAIRSVVAGCLAFAAPSVQAASDAVVNYWCQYEHLDPKIAPPALPDMAEAEWAERNTPTRLTALGVMAERLVQLSMVRSALDPLRSMRLIEGVDPNLLSDAIDASSPQIDAQVDAMVADIGKLLARRAGAVDVQMVPGLCMTPRDLIGMASRELPRHAGLRALLGRLPAERVPLNERGRRLVSATRLTDLLQQPPSIHGGSPLEPGDEDTEATDEDDDGVEDSILTASDVMIPRLRFTVASMVGHVDGPLRACDADIAARDVMQLCKTGNVLPPDEDDEEEEGAVTAAAPRRVADAAINRWNARLQRTVPGDLIAVRDAGRCRFLREPVEYVDCAARFPSAAVAAADVAGLPYLSQDGLVPTSHGLWLPDGDHALGDPARVYAVRAGRVTATNEAAPVATFVFPDGAVDCAAPPPARTQWRRDAGESRLDAPPVKTMRIDNVGGETTMRPVDGLDPLPLPRNGRAGPVDMPMLDYSPKQMAELQKKTKAQVGHGRGLRAHVPATVALSIADPSCGVRCRRQLSLAFVTAFANWKYRLVNGETSLAQSPLTAPVDLFFAIRTPVGAYVDNGYVTTVAHHDEKRRWRGSSDEDDTPDPSGVHAQPFIGYTQVRASDVQLRSPNPASNRCSVEAAFNAVDGAQRADCAIFLDIMRVSIDLAPLRERAHANLVDGQITLSTGSCFVDASDAPIDGWQTVCAKPGVVRVSLADALTHETGHWLGVEHAADADAATDIMAKDYGPGACIGAASVGAADRQLSQGRGVKLKAQDTFQ